MIDFSLTSEAIKSRLDAIAENDKHIRAALDHAGYPVERRTDHSFTALLRIIVGQQLSVKAAASIFDRVATLMEGDPAPDKIPALSDETLRGAGLSFQKIRYVRSLAEAVDGGPLDLKALPHMADEEAIDAITSVKGLGRWSAQMYLMFALGREDIWPVDDLAVRVGAGRIIGLEDRPSAKELDLIGEKWRPHRSVIALLSWHYYSNAPL
ncbi:DNA-3-methyladenine glycosidase [Kordiimonas sediminis]|uniref:DNA-3-methyladenine glycosylase II n=1 Tax=Kordiimonas sediminis TaxID=1735581 RepID=A0A919AKP4_9PROT|nr:DNA-3-methyladenine glycosylase 2 family protein [Kordiimonas sediminis]GHF12186.1 DNA-3-methyladenine glycosidase [Kordiimonas sediminis]